MNAEVWITIVRAVISSVTAVCVVALLYAQIERTVKFAAGSADRTSYSGAGRCLGLTLMAAGILGAAAVWVWWVPILHETATSLLDVSNSASRAFLAAGGLCAVAFDIGAWLFLNAERPVGTAQGGE